jgi:adenylate cyclase
MTIENKKTIVTIVYCDVRNFAKIVNLLSLEEVYRFLNDCFSLFTDVAFEYDGRIDKFLGDVAMVVFGIPHNHTNDPTRAVRYALDIQQRAEEISIKWRPSLNFLVEIDMGISTGEVIAGAVGSEKRKDYTVVGKNVNLAATLQRLCDDYNEHILLDQATYDRVKDVLKFRHVDEKILLGFIKPVTLYTPTQDTV